MYRTWIIHGSYGIENCYWISTVFLHWWSNVRWFLTRYCQTIYSVCPQSLIIVVSREWKLGDVLVKTPKPTQSFTWRSTFLRRLTLIAVFFNTLCWIWEFEILIAFMFWTLHNQIFPKAWHMLHVPLAFFAPSKNAKNVETIREAMRHLATPDLTDMELFPGFLRWWLLHCLMIFNCCMFGTWFE